MVTTFLVVGQDWVASRSRFPSLLMMIVYSSRMLSGRGHWLLSLFFRWVNQMTWVHASAKETFDSLNTDAHWFQLLSRGYKREKKIFIPLLRTVFTIPYTHQIYPRDISFLCFFNCRYFFEVYWRYFDVINWFEFKRGLLRSI